LRYNRLRIIHWGNFGLSNDTIAERMVKAELQNMAGHIVGNRPGRVEPRAVKRRPKPHALLTKPREQARAELLGAGSP